MSFSGTPVWHDYDYALLRVVPRVQWGTFLNVGVVLHARTAGFLGARYHLDYALLRPLCPSPLNLVRLERHLQAYLHLCEGGSGLGPLGLLPASERFHWLTAPRSAVLQPSALRAGRTTNPADSLERLFQALLAHLPS